MTATDELRRLLDERGVEYEGGERSLRWRDRYGIMMQAFPLANGELGMGVWSCTPAQAIAATLGRGTCHNEDGWCSECQHFLHVGFEWCPWCGRKVVAPTTNDVDAEVDA